MINKGKFISLEGIDGCGKTTNIPFIAEYLTSKGFEVETVRDPGGTQLGEELRKIALNTPCSLLTELLIFTASRQQLVDEVILPKLNKGCIVISDRFADSSYAYQGYGRGLLAEVCILESMLCNRVKPDYTLFLDITMNESLNRIRTRQAATDKFEQELISFKQKIHDGFVHRAKMFPDRIHTIDANCNQKEVQSLITEWLDTNFIEQNKHLIKG